MPHMLLASGFCGAVNQSHTHLTAFKRDIAPARDFRSTLFLIGLSVLMVYFTRMFSKQRADFEAEFWYGSMTTQTSFYCV
jgi:hypothetical protein